MSANSSICGLRSVRRGRRCLQWALFMFIAAGMTTIVGCRALTGSARTGGPADSANVVRGSSDERGPRIDGIMGPTERMLKQASWDREKQAAAGSDGRHIEGLAEYQAAEKLFQAGRYRDAEKAFAQLARDRRTGGMNFGERVVEALRTGLSDPTADGLGDPIEEDALFMLAESQFKQKKFSWAQDSYDKLLERYPSSRHLNTVTHRLFGIAQDWMGFPDVNEDNNVELASAELRQTNPRVGDRSFERPSFFNVTDRSRPLFDTAGRALQALQSIWLHDANGPLADDALMLTANYHLQTGNFVEAARIYQLLREQYPDSPHFKDAYLLDSHVRLASYEGPSYDDKSLETSEQLRETALRLFPDLSPEQRQRLDEELKRIHLAKVQRIWNTVEFYQSKGNDAAVALHCNKILNLYKDTPYAQRAREALGQLKAEYRQPQSSPFDFFSGPEATVTSPVLAGIVRPSPRSPQTGQADVSASPAGSAEASATAADEQSQLLRRMLSPVRESPHLQPIDAGAAEETGAAPGTATLRPPVRRRSP